MLKHPKKMEPEFPARTGKLRTSTTWVLSSTQIPVNTDIGKLRTTLMGTESVPEFHVYGLCVCDQTLSTTCSNTVLLILVSVLDTHLG